MRRYRLMTGAAYSCGKLRGEQGYGAGLMMGFMRFLGGFPTIFTVFMISRPYEPCGILFHIMFFSPIQYFFLSLQKPTTAKGKREMAGSSHAMLGTLVEGGCMLQ